MAGPNSNWWNLVGEAEDRLALLVDVEQRREKIERLALYEASHDDIYKESVAMIADLRQFKLSLKRLRDDIEKAAKEA